MTPASIHFHHQRNLESLNQSLKKICPGEEKEGCFSDDSECLRTNWTSTLELKWSDCSTGDNCCGLCLGFLYQGVLPQHLMDKYLNDVMLGKCIKEKKNDYSFNNQAAYIDWDAYTKLQNDAVSFRLIGHEVPIS
ncbi:hypothetical protein CMV_000475 [Castanea mollissima]|uniref:Uncharacterized protein n=1 Tax=Castanea mollissima TaxID=60419 RepID=A0A8J4RWW7_9ROSI|nr:hypothetical protein CMV_000475 [Castanea mollissima]